MNQRRQIRMLILIDSEPFRNSRGVVPGIYPKTTPLMIFLNIKPFTEFPQSGNTRIAICLSALRSVLIHTCDQIIADNRDRYNQIFSCGIYDFNIVAIRP